MARAISSSKAARRILTLRHERFADAVRGERRPAGRDMADQPSSPLVIDPPWLADPGLQAVLRALTADGAEARFVGGCVRNALLGPDAPASTDIDIAIDRPPQETIRLLEQAALKAVPTGVDHGTVTALTPKTEDGGGAPVEITSLRRDVETDGRRAVVAYTDDWAEDAMRRDFTMNALYADAAGRVYDPLGGGAADLAARRLRFIGSAEERIREDYLRIMRYFRFFAWYGSAGGLDPRDLEATTRLAPGLDGLARERVGAELKKVLSAPAPAEAVAAMAGAGALTRSLPGFEASSDETAARLDRLEQTERQAALPARWTRRMAAILGEGLGGGLDVRGLTDALRLSRAENSALTALGKASSAPAGEAAYRWGAEAACDAAALRAASQGAPIAAATLAAIETGASAVLPVSAQDLIDAGFQPGPRLGSALKAAERDWIANGFDPDPAPLLARSKAAAGIL